MTIIAQNDTGTVSGANVYIDIAYADAYFLARNNEAWVDLDIEVKEAAILEASAFIDFSNTGKFKGTKLTQAQFTQFPRSGVYDSNSYSVTGIPECLKQATAEYANRSRVETLAPDNEYEVSGIALKSKTEKVGPITNAYVYQDGQEALSKRKYPFADMLISDLILPRGGIIRG